MNNIKTVFTIKDLENLSGIKAHTLRIWEKRYDLLKPERTDTNIRYYDIKNLQKLLNVKFLYDNGGKISKIALLNEEELPIKVRQIITERGYENHSLNTFKLAMLNFDQSLFEHTYNQILAEKTFRGVFQDVFIPFLNEIGYLWQSETITPAHEHFITNLIKQKLHSNIERIQLRQPENNENVYVLYLPLNEIHELGLLYLHYELVLQGHQSIYLGQSVPLDNLFEVQKLYSNVTFVTYLTVQPDSDTVSDYLNALSDTIKSYDNNALIFGRKLEEVEINSTPENLIMFKKIDDFINKKF